MDLSVPVVGASPWLVLAGFGSVVFGFTYVLLKVRQYSGGGIGVFRKALAQKQTSLLVILGADFLGGIVAGLAAVLVGMSQPETLVRIIRDTPAAGWFLLGLAGPVLSDRLLAGSVLRGRFESQLTKGDPSDQDLLQRGDLRRLHSSVWRLRSEAVKSIELAVWVLVQRDLITGTRRLRLAARELIVDRPDDARDLVLLVRRLRDGRRVAVPPSVLVAAERLEADSSEENTFTLFDALVNELLDAQIWWPLEVLCGDPASDAARGASD